MTLKHLAKAETYDDIMKIIGYLKRGGSRYQDSTHGMVVTDSPYKNVYYLMSTFYKDRICNHFFLQEDEETDCVGLLKMSAGVPELVRMTDTAYSQIFPVHDRVWLFVNEDETRSLMVDGNFVLEGITDDGLYDVGELIHFLHMSSSGKDYLLCVDPLSLDTCCFSPANYEELHTWFLDRLYILGRDKVFDEYPLSELIRIEVLMKDTVFTKSSYEKLVF